MKYHFNRRDFLRLSGLLPLSILASRYEGMLGALQPPSGQNKNVLVIVFDAFSAYHVSMYGYQRETTPNLARLAKRAVVYHNHYSGSNFTSAGTASLLTGTLPWTHRALQSNSTVIDSFATKNIFSAFNKNYYTIAYSHNPWVNTLLEQFSGELDELVPWQRLLLQSYDQFIQTLFKKDLDIASVSWTRNINIREQGYAYSLFLSHIYKALRENSTEDVNKLFPRGIPSIDRSDISFLLEQAIDWTANRLTVIPQPFLGYFHFLPPHGPYRTSLEFYNKFRDDGFMPVDKPEDVFAKGALRSDLIRKRAEYDEFLLYADKGFGRLFDSLETSGVLENTWVVLTSDHGELFERGMYGHSEEALYEPVIRIPLLIFEPGRKTGIDIYSPTSAIDLLPTLTHLTGDEIPNWAEGAILPPYAPAGPDRSIYAVRANKTDHYAPLTRASIALIKGRYKLLYYFGYSDYGVDELVKLYDIKADPEELTDLYSSQRAIADDMLKEVKSKLAEADKPYI